MKAVTVPGNSALKARFISDNGLRNENGQNRTGVTAHEIKIKVHIEATAVFSCWSNGLDSMEEGVSGQTRQKQANVMDEYKCICITMRKLKFKIYEARRQNERFIFQLVLFIVFISVGYRRIR